MIIRFQASLLLVKDVAASKDFYVRVLEQEVEYDFGEDVSFRGGFVIHDANHFSRLLFDRDNPNSKTSQGQENLELYFETEQLEESFARIEEYGVEFIHRIIEQPWGQHVFRFYDPDRHIVEIGEPMQTVIRRMLKEGLSEEEIAQRTSMPPAEIAAVKAAME